MMNIKHHLTDDILMAYSAGTLPEAFNLVVATHLSMCDECRAAAASYDAVGGAVLESDEVATISDGAFKATLKLISEMPKDAIQTVQAHKPGIFPTPLQDYVGGDLDSVQWRGIGMGVKQAVLKTSKEASVRLLYIPAGAAMPDHSHKGMEMTLVLQGAFSDEDGRFGRGDIEIADQELHHHPVAEAGEDCICLAATDAPLKFNSLIPRIAQPFLRI
ncbi:ChrR family anti-sigma-E factor [Cognatishimia sp. MH4019]|uniref:ChrR family anti-sigma-E factor n=1 Tax=Cognatishimia sp. MH4019 TaxID=2854030 RepID=UPI00271510F7|nr:ChrR family anti-sigma-E factor [Cognatishimia sp. MH4019]